MEVKLNTGDTADTVDTNTYLITKPLSDETNIIDEITISIIKPITDEVLLGDDTVFTFNKLEVDSVDANDFIQDYAESDYFLEYYAASTSITFS